jgi:transposase
MPEKDTVTPQDTSEGEGNNTAAETGTPPDAVNGETVYRTQKQFDEAFTARLERARNQWEREAEAKRTAERKKAEDAAAKAAGEWQKVAEQRERELDDLRADIERRELNMLKARIGTEEGLPTRLHERLAGSTEAELREDAKALKKELGPPKAPDLESGGRGAAPTQAQLIEATKQSQERAARYTGY